MRKIVAITCILFGVLFVSCDYDDSNDIDILTPNDSTDTGVVVSKFPQ